MKPKDEQIKRLWEKCGFTNLIGEQCLYPEDKGTGRYAYIPDIELNNLFKYAVPKVKEKLTWQGYYKFLLQWVRDFTIDDKDPALALFWAIYKAWRLE